MSKVLKLVFHLSVFILIIVSLWPGNLIGYLFYGRQEVVFELFEKPLGVSVNHFVSYLWISLLGFALYCKNKIFNKLIFALFFLSSILELFHFIIPERSFEISDLISNIFGVMVAYLIIKIYLSLYKA